MLFYPVTPPDVTPPGTEDAALGLLGRAGMVAVRVADLASPAGPDLGKDGRSALVAAGAGKIRSGDAVVFLKPVAVARGRWSAGTGGCRLAGIRLIMPGWAWPRTGWMPWPASRM